MQRGSPPPFVGRSDELTTIARALNDALSGDHPGVVCLVGAAGIGKTSMAERVASDAAHDGTRVLWTRCWNGAGTPALWPWSQLLTELFGGDHVGEAMGSGLPHRTVEDRFARFEAIGDALRRASTDTPTLLVIDDLHWADAASLELLHFIARDHRPTGLSILTTYRAPDVVGGPLSDRIAAIEREATTLTLTGIGQDAVATCLDHLGLDADRLAEMVHQRTEGNPFFVHELGQLLQRQLAATGAMPTSLPLTTGVRAVIEEHLALVPAPVRRLLELAAVQGRVFDVDVLQAADGADLLSVEQRLGVAEERQLVTTEGAEGWRFGHALIGEALLSSLSPHDIAHHHLATADGLEANHGRLHPDHTESIANHLLSAGSLATPDRLLATAVAAADVAHGRLAWEEELHHLATAVHAIRSFAEPDLGRLVEVEIRRCGVAKRLNQIEVARSIALSAAEVARRLDDPRPFAHVALVFPPDSEGIEIDEIHDPDQQRLREEALTALGDVDPVLRARVQAALALSLYWATPIGDRARSHRDSSERRDQLTTEALDFARRVDDPVLLSEALTSRIYANWGPAAKAERPALAEELIAVAEAAGDPQRALAGRVWRVSRLLERAELDAADREIREFEADAHRHHDRLHIWTALRWRANRAFMRGEFSDCEAIAAEALDLAVQIMPTEIAFQFFTTTMGPVMYLQGRLGDNFEYVRDTAAASPNVPAWRIGLATIACEIGELDIARRELGALAADDFSMLPRDLNFLGSMVMAALITHTVGDASVARSIEGHLTPFGGQLAIHGTGYASYGTIDHALAQCAETCGDVERAIGLYRSGIALADRIGSPYADVGRLYLGRALAADDPANAAALLLAAREGFERWGLTVFADRAATERLDVVEGCELALVHSDGGWALRRSTAEPVPLPALKGFVALQRLLRHPGAAVEAVELAAVLDGHGGEWLAAERPIERIDQVARRSYESRLAELEELLDRADERGDAAASAALDSERAALLDELRSATGFAGRTVHEPAAADRARVNVTKHLKRAIERIAEVDPVVGRHLTGAIQTGSCCTFRPADDDPFRWGTPA